MTSQVPQTTDGGRQYVGYIPKDAPLTFAEGLALPYELPRTDRACRERYGKPGRRVVITIKAQELPE